MNPLILPSELDANDRLIAVPSKTKGLEGKLHIAVRVMGETLAVCLSAEDEARLYQYLSERRGAPPAEFVTLERITESDALTRIADALEKLAPVADALTKLASYATEDGLAESARIP